MSTLKMYSIPDRFRKIENLHIIFWLLKDLSWAMLWRPIGMIMIVPTIAVAVMITWQTRKLKSELFHNLAVVFWIFANGFWMITEFFTMPDMYRYFTAIPFSFGILVIAYYYIIVLPKEKREEKLVTISIEVPESVLKVAKAD